MYIGNSLACLSSVGLTVLFIFVLLCVIFVFVSTRHYKTSAYVRRFCHQCWLSQCRTETLAAQGCHANDASACSRTNGTCYCPDQLDSYSAHAVGSHAPCDLSDS